MSSYTPPQPSELPSGPSGANKDETSEYGFSHTMFRITDARKSLHFYCEVLGMTLLSRSDSEGGKFTNYFLCYPDSSMPNKEKDPAKFNAWMWTRQGLLELCHNWGNETDGSKMCNGNEPEHRGFGHICVFVDDLAKAVARLDKMKVTFTKRPEQGTMRHIAFVADPDGYRVEIITKGKI